MIFYVVVASKTLGAQLPIFVLLTFAQCWCWFGPGTRLGVYKQRHRQCSVGAPFPLWEIQAKPSEADISLLSFSYVSQDDLCIERPLGI
jgi:hypothetical protein